MFWHPMFWLSMALAIMLASMPVRAQQPPCGPSRQMYDHLSRAYGESRKYAGIAGQIIVELWVNDSTRSWTILTTRPDGQSCMSASGEEWGAAPSGEPI